MNKDEPQVVIDKSEKGNKIFYIILALLIASSVGITFYKIVILKNYQIVAQVSCDPKQEKCFVSQCDPATDTTCPEKLYERISYYKNISKKAATIYACESTTPKIGCNEELSCTEGEQDCSYTFCDPAELADGEACSE
jgi:hypothetical protein